MCWGLVVGQGKPLVPLRGAAKSRLLQKGPEGLCPWQVGGEPRKPRVHTVRSRRRPLAQEGPCVC